MTEQDFIRQFKWSPETFAVAKSSNFRCVYCGLRFFESVHNWTLFNIDHVRPSAALGEPDDRPENKVAACWPCNKLKGMFDPATVNPSGTKDDWIQIAKDHIAKVHQARMQKKVKPMYDAAIQLGAIP